VSSVLKSLFYLLGSAVFAIILKQKLYELTGWHLIDILLGVISCVAWLLKGGT
jgi:hypothetical protein